MQIGRILESCPDPFSSAEQMVAQVCWSLGRTVVACCPRFVLFYSRTCCGPLLAKPPRASSAAQQQDEENSCETSMVSALLQRAMHMTNILSLKQPFYMLVFGLDRELATKWLYNWSSGLVLAEFCTIFRAWLVQRGPGANFGQKPDQNSKKLKQNDYFSQRLNCH
jgi:hypothetical protein